MKELAGRLAKLNDMINAEFPAFADDMRIGVGLGMTAFAAIKTRIVKSGQSADGGTYKPYSTKPILVGAKSFTKEGQNIWKKSGESTGRGGGRKTVFQRKNKEKNQWRTITRNGINYRLILLPGGYKEIRRIEGLPTAHKEFLRTGEMWNSIHVEGTRQEGRGKFITTVGTQNELSNKKLEGNTKREGKEILDCMKSEEKMLDELLDVFITKLVNRAING